MANNEFPGDNGSQLTLSTQSDLISTPSGTTADSADSIIPRGALFIGYSLRITTTITGPTSISIGYSTDDDGFADTTNPINSFTTLTAGTEITNLAYTEVLSGADNVLLLLFNEPRKIQITANGGDFTAGAIRVVVWYFETTAPTS